MPRILFFVFIAFVVWTIVRMLGSARKREDRAPTSPTVAAEPIVQCAWCGVHVPTGQLVTLPDGRRYCGDAHRDAARQAAGDRRS